MDYLQKLQVRKDSYIRIDHSMHSALFLNLAMHFIHANPVFFLTPVIAGDKVLELNGIDSHEFKSLNEMKKILKEVLKITVVILRKDLDASDSSASSVDYDVLKAIQPPDVYIKGTKNAEEDDDTAPFDGDCGCIWCPHCHE